MKQNYKCCTMNLYSHADEQEHGRGGLVSNSARTQQRARGGEHGFRHLTERERRLSEKEKTKEKDENDNSV